jgi:hypothetical protein
MQQNEKDKEQALQDALGTPKYYIDTEGKKEGERYFWFPTQGDSMTNNTHQSIPAGSMVLGRLLPLQTITDIPLHKLVVVIIDDGGHQFCMLKIVCNIAPTTEDAVAQFCLHSYNTRYNDFWLPFSCVKFIFEVERVRLANGNEFEP